VFNEILNHDACAVKGATKQADDGGLALGKIAHGQTVQKLRSDVGKMSENDKEIEGFARLF